MGINRRPYYFGIAFVSIFLLWQIISIFADQRILPSPITVLANIFSANGRPLLFHAAASLYRILVGLLISLVIGTSIGLTMGYYARWDAFFSSFVYLLYPIPKIALLPILIFFIGYGEACKLTIIVLVVVFQIIVSCRDGVRAIPRETFYSLQALGANDAQIFRHVVIPATLPAIFTSLRVSLGAAISVLFFTEIFANDYGLGYYIWSQASIRFDYVATFSGIVVLSLLGFLLFYLIDVLKRLCCRWHEF